MGDLKSKDFPVVGRCLLCAALGVSLLPEASAMSSERYDDHFRGQPVQIAQSSSADSIANIQRLLTILADRYKQKFGEVNPGRVDGSYGAETRLAIRRYQETVGIKPGSQTNEQLVADLLATLAAMSASPPAEDSNQPDQLIAAFSNTEKKKPTTDEAANGKTVETPGSADEQPAKETAKPAATAPAAIPRRTRSAYDAPVPPPKVAVPPPVEQVTKMVSQAPATTKDDRVYFTQLASLRTLEAAQREWQRIFEANRAALNGEQVYFEEAEIAGRGTFHRILVGPIQEHDAAKVLCGFLKQNDQPCVVISRLLSALRNLRDKNGELAPVHLPAPPRDSKLAEATPTTGPAVGADASGVSKTTATNVEARQTAPTASADQSHNVPRVLDDMTAPAMARTAVTTDPTAKVETEKSALPLTPVQQPVPAMVPINEASKVFNEKPTGSAYKTTGATPVTEDAKSAAGPAVAAPPIDAAAPPGPANPAPAIDGAKMASVPKTPTGSAAGTAPAAVPDATQRAPGESKTATLVPFSQSPGAAPAPVKSADDATKSADTATPSAGSPSQDALQTSGAFDGISPYLGQTRNVIGAVVIMLLAASALLFVWWQRTRRGALAQIFRPANYSFGQPTIVDTGETDTLTALETDFDSEQLRESRSIRDNFLRDILGDNVDLEQTTAAMEPAIRINSSLKSLFVSDPTQYKSIFLNWIFLSKVGAALNQNEITMEDLNGHFGREFKLLQNYFKIHLLELDDRHRIRKELPGLFYCLQLAQQRQRQAAGTA